MRVTDLTRAILALRRQHCDVGVTPALQDALRLYLKIADRRYASPLPDADWTLCAADIVQAQLSVSLSRHVPGWPGATDEQLAAVGREIIDALDAIPGPSR